jgi:PII-like signaling protein
MAGEDKTMNFRRGQVLLNVYLQSTDKHGWVSAIDKLVEYARRDGLAGATVLRGIFGFDAEGKLLEPRRWSLVQPASVVVRLADEPEVIEAFLPVISEVAPRALVTVQEVFAQRYRRGHRPVSAATGYEKGASSLSCPALAGSPERPLTTSVGEAGQVLRVFVRGSDIYEGQPLYRAIVLRAHEQRLAWAAVLRGAMGYGAAGRLRIAKLFKPAGDLPVVVEIVGKGRKVERLLPFLDEAVGEGTTTLKDVSLCVS